MPDQEKKFLDAPVRLTAPDLPNPFENTVVGPFKVVCKFLVHCAVSSPSFFRFNRLIC